MNNMTQNSDGDQNGNYLELQVKYLKFQFNKIKKLKI